jgi:hypothetical protein
MKKSRFSEEQIAYALRLADSGTPVVAVAGGGTDGRTHAFRHQAAIQRSRRNSVEWQLYEVQPPPGLLPSAERHANDYFRSARTRSTDREPTSVALNMAPCGRPVGPASSRAEGARCELGPERAPCALGEDHLPGRPRSAPDISSR